MARILSGELPSIEGTYIPSGIRVGPKCPPPSSLSSPAGLRDCWGEGMYTGQHFTYRILPKPGLAVGVAASDIVQPVAFGDSTIPSTPYKLTLSQSDNTVSPRTTTSYVKNGNTAIQLDYPRCPEVRLLGDTASETINLTINVYGYDFYMQPMTDQIICNAPTAGVASAIKTNKAFYGITDIYVMDITGVPVGAFGFLLTVSASDRFGLPYKLQESAHLVAYSQGSVSSVGILPPINEAGTPSFAGSEASYIFPTWFPLESTITDGATLYPWLISYPNVIQAGSRAAGTITSIDPRGLFDPQNKLSHSGTDPATDYELANVTSDWSNSSTPFLSFTYYVAGGDNFQDQMLNIQDTLSQLGNSGPDPVAYQSSFKSMWSTALPVVTTATLLKGFPQFYLAPPA